MKAKFKAKAPYYKGGYKFTVGNHYDLEAKGSNYYSTIDDNGDYAYFENGRYYEFELFHYTEKSYPKEKKMTYRMNGCEVTKDFFEDKLLEVKNLKDNGVSVFIDFEVSFE